MKEKVMNKLLLELPHGLGSALVLAISCIVIKIVCLYQRTSLKNKMTESMHLINT